MSEVLSELLLKRYRGNNRYVAAWKEGSPQPFEIKGGMDRFPPEEFAKRHFGDTCLGFYLINPADDCVTCAALDFDNHDGESESVCMDARTVYTYLLNEGYYPVLEQSQSGTGVHVWLHFSQPIPAEKVRRFLKKVLKDCEVTCEIYPAQDSVSNTEKRLGNLIRYPLWNMSQFVNVHFEPLDAQTVLEDIQEIDDLPDVPETAVSVTYHEYDTVGLPGRVADVLSEEPTSTLAKRWAADVGGMRNVSTSELVMAIATELVHYKIPTPEIEAAISYWCDKQGYEKATNQWVHRTVANAYNYRQQKDRHLGTDKTFMELAHRQVDQILQGNEELIPFGVRKVDHSLQGGIETGEFGIVWGPPGHCKTAVVMSWLSAGAKAGYPGLFFSLDMPPKTTAKRMLAMMGLRTDSETLSRMSAHEIHERIDEHYENSGMAPLYYRDRKNGRDLDYIVETVEHYRSRYGVKFVVVDYQELVNAGRDKLDAQEKVCQAFKDLTDTGIAIISLVQPNKGYEGKRPKLRDLKYAGAAEADMVIAGIYPYIDEPVPANRKKYHMYVLKSRRGFEDGEMVLGFDPEHQQFFSEPQSASTTNGESAF